MTPTLFITSVDELEIQYVGLKKLKRDCPGYQSSVVVFPPQDAGDLVLHDLHFEYLLRVASKLRCKTLTFIRVAFNLEKTRFKGCLDYLENINLNGCRGIIAFLPKMLEHCRKLITFSETEPGKRPERGTVWHRIRHITKPLEDLEKALKVNYRLTKFESLTLKLEIPVLMKAGIRAEERKVLNGYEKIVGMVLQRNHHGYVRCRMVIYQLFLIKRHRPDSVFRFINRDIVMIIAKMLYATIGTKIWCT
jgi:hypothetical protein